MVEEVENIMIGIRVEDSVATRLRNLGLKYVYRTKKEQDALTAFYGQGFKRNSAYRGHPLVDTADVQLFTEDGQDNVSFRYIMDDLEKFGYKPVIAEILRNEGRGCILRLFYNREKGNTYLEPGLKKEVREILKRVQRSVFGYFHEESLTMDKNVRFTGSIINLNTANGYLNQAAQEKTSIQFIRVINEKGRVQCQPAPDDFAENLRLELGLPDNNTEPQPLTAPSSAPAGDAQ